jgi:NADPH-dependent curcumin reductase CurA
MGHLAEHEVDIPSLAEGEVFVKRKYIGNDLAWPSVTA